MKTNTAQKIIDYIEQNQKVSPKAITEYLGITPVAVFRQLAKLLKQGKITKFGTPPKVFYALPEIVDGDAKRATLGYSDIINKYFLKITPEGVLQMGSEAFLNWCLARGLNPDKTLEEYEKAIHKFEGYKKDGLIDGMSKLQKTFEVVYLNKMYYLDFYSIERFGKTKLGELVLYAKQSQNKDLVKMIVGEIRDKILKLIDQEKVDAVGFVPPTIK
jgi:DNA-binding Lrp family transcriptional regulator